MIKFSVKKTFTVLVGVIIIIVLGVVSFMNMSTDLLPNIELPYVVAVTSYPGATPEKVEATVTRPLESVVATTSGVKNVTSVSNENMSMVIMEFEQGNNMDAAMIELNNMVTRVSAQLDDAVGSPVLMKISPDMLPIMVAGVDYDGKDEKELSKYISETLLPEFERIDGVASVKASGLTEQRITVTLDDKKVDKINNNLLKTIDSELYKAKVKIDDGLVKIADGRKKLSVGKNELDTKQNQGAAALAAASAQVDAAIAKLQGLLSEGTILESNQKAFKAELAGMKKLQQSKSSLMKLASGIVQASFVSKIPNMSTPPTTEQLVNAAQIKDKMENALKNPIKFIKENLTDNQFAVLYKAVLAGLPSGSLPSEMENLSKSDFLSYIEKAEKADERITQINTELTNIETRLAVVNAMKPQLEKALKKAEDGYEKLEAQKISALTGITNGSVQMSATEQTLNSAEQKLKDAQTEFENSRDMALKKANISDALNSKTISKILTAQNFSMPAGYVEEDGMDQHLIKVGDTYSSIKQLKNTLLTNIDKGGIGDVLLKDIAKVQLVDNAGDSYARLNSNPAIIINFQKQSTASTSEVSDAINAKIKQLQGSENGLSVTPLMDQGNYIHIIIGSVLSNLLWGGLLAILVLAIFLKDVKPTLIIACSIPISLMFAIALMYFTNVTLNVISLSGLALGVGMLVDNSIVVIENIYRLRNQGYSPAKAAIKGAKEVAGALAASTLTTICVFIPIVFTEGMSRQIFADMGLTIGYSLVASLVIALTVVPAMGSTILKKTNNKTHHLFDRFTNAYEKVLCFSLKHRAAVLIAVVAVLGLAVFQATQIGTAFMPEVQMSQMQATLNSDEKHTKKEFREIADKVVKRMADVEGVATVGIMESSDGSIMSASGGGNSSGMSLYILLDSGSNPDTAKIEQQLVKATDGYNCELEVSSSAMNMSALGGKGISIALKGDNLDTLYKMSDDLTEKLGKVKGLTDISNGREESTKQTVVTVNKTKAMRQGLTVAQIYQSMAGDLSAETKATTVTVDGSDYPVVIENIDSDITRKNILDYEITSTDVKTGDSKKVTLGDIAESKEAESPFAINRDNSHRTITVSAQIDAEHNVGLLSRDVEKILGDYNIPTGYSADIKGENEQITAAMGDLGLMILLAILFIYLIMVAQFQSLICPFIVILTVPLAVTGGLLALWITGSELSVVAAIGFLVLAGVVVNNGIVFVDYVNRLRLSGMERREALIQAGRTRLRPILMTALTTILAMVTMAMGIGEGADMTAPIGIVIIGGLSYATILTLVVVPVLCDIFLKKPPHNVNKELEE